MTRLAASPAPANDAPLEGTPRADGGRRERMLVPVLFLVTCVASIISSLGAPLVPLVADDLHISLADAQWSLTAALLAGAVCAPILGRLGDGPRRREALVAGLVVVLLGGVLAALAGSLWLLIVGRVMQGIGLGLIPLALSAARDGLPAERVGPAIALLSVSAAAGVGLGYPISGLIATSLGLAAAYWFGAVFALFALVAVVLVLPASTATERARVEPTGAVLLSGGLVALLLAIGQGEAWGWGSTRILGLVVLAAAALSVWVRRELRTPHPLIELRLLRHRSVLTADVAAFVLGIAMYIDLSVVTTFVQSDASVAGYGFGASVLTAGLCLLPFSIGSLVATRLLPQAQRLVGEARVLPLGCLVVAAAGGFFALEHAALWEAFAAMAILGIGLGYTFATLPGLIVRAVPEQETGSAMGFYQVVRYIGFSLGSAVAAAVLAAHTARSGIPSVDGFSTALWLGAACCVAAAGLAWLLPRARGAAPLALEVEEGELATAGVVGRESRRPVAA